MPRAAAWLVLALLQQRARALGLFQGLVDVEPTRLQQWARVDIGRRQSELVALGWLGRAYRVAPAAVDAVLPEVFAFERYDGQDWVSTGDAVHATMKFGTAVVPRGVPLSLRLGLAGGVVDSARVDAVGPDLFPDDVDGEALADADAARLCAQLNGDGRRLVVDALCATVFQTLAPALKLRDAPLVALGPPRAFAPRRDLWAREGSSEKWLQGVSEYYFADAQLQEVALGGEGPSFVFYLDPSEPPNSANPTRNVNPEVLCCKFR